MEFTDEDFEEEVLEVEDPVFVGFLGSWCTACQRMKPIVEELEEEYDGKVKIGYLNIDKNPQISGKYEIEETPTHILFEGGEVVERKMGAMAKFQLEKMLEGVLEK